MVNSMTGFAALKGAAGNTRWGWEIRSVNARGLDIRLRLPDGMDGLEVALRKEIAAKISRGNVNLTLRLLNETKSSAIQLDVGSLAVVIDALKAAEEAADAKGVNLTASTAADVLALRGVLEPGAAEEEDTTALLAALQADVPVLVAEFAAARASEGAAIHAILTDQLVRLQELLSRASKAAEARLGVVAAGLRDNLAMILQNADGADPDRVAQELAILAIKADVTEELDRLQTHVGAAGELLTKSGAIGRKFDFLMQEFNREANTLCSKSGSTDLTAIGLDLKTVIDQMREQVQNVE